MLVHGYCASTWQARTNKRANPFSQHPRRRSPALHAPASRFPKHLPAPTHPQVARLAAVRRCGATQAAPSAKLRSTQAHRNRDATDKRCTRIAHKPIQAPPHETILRQRRRSTTKLVAFGGPATALPCRPTFGHRPSFLCSQRNAACVRLPLSFRGALSLLRHHSACCCCCCCCNRCC